MHSEFDHFSFLGMSNSESFLVKDDEKEIEFEVLSRPTLEFPDGYQFTASTNDPDLQEDDHDRNEEEKESSKELKTPLLVEIEVEDDDDGFRTPTSWDHKIAMITQCPPAPKKLRPRPSRKRKSSRKLGRNLLLDLSKELHALGIQLIFLSMSNSESFLVKEEKIEIEFEVWSSPTLEFRDGRQVTASNDDPKLQADDDKNEEDKSCEVNPESSKELKTPLLSEIEVADDDDGFRTPTSSDHKIPIITQCPPAPNKLRPQPSRKRKLSQKLSRNIQLDLSKEVESMFPPTLQDYIGSKIKKARRNDKE
ncbi:hypothetical protein F0562_016728 [Nyssa sinensis]|uniref:Uncharacterized protein n=1 Tax=Nyssa sinensis TaxID=561372 RepID=A0A5J4ZCR6_9ASTE|nr:hypothetical protein F0562_016728 [Nyssa sinensis]